MESQDIKACVDDLKKLKGISPYNTSTNYVVNDSWFWMSIQKKYSKETIKQAEQVISKEVSNAY